MQVIALVVVDETQFPESVHEETDSRAGGPDHLSQSFLTESWNGHFGNAFFAELRHQ
jgi:hypothetical protein